MSEEQVTWIGGFKGETRDGAVAHAFFGEVVTEERSDRVLRPLCGKIGGTPGCVPLPAGNAQRCKTCARRAAGVGRVASKMGALAECLVGAIRSCGPEGGGTDAIHAEVQRTVPPMDRPWVLREQMLRPMIKRLCDRGLVRQVAPGKWAIKQQAPVARPLIVGESNPYQGDPRFALYPTPRGSAGDRLCRLVMGLEPSEYLTRFDRVNLCPELWSRREARQHAEAIAAEGRAVLVLLGARVAEAFGAQPRAPFSVRTVGASRAVLLPHPSGRARTWNQPGAFERARSLLREVGALPPMTAEERDDAGLSVGRDGGAL